MKLCWVTWMHKPLSWSGLTRAERIRWRESAPSASSALSVDRDLEPLQSQESGDQKRHPGGLVESTSIADAEDLDGSAPRDARDHLVNSVVQNEVKMWEGRS